ncbi:SDR family oxidoreductase [Sphingomonas bacterium]|uniref:SDR family oxidoreductase n=1 Tax=Sphingomonas bacterium TaxID=1895847 RepID=UPI00157500E1|nr:SDR family oxidoreductase [Sphingomonas bacterium]
MSEIKAIFITGGGSGIGRATARLFASRGWRVGVADIDDAGLAETIAMIGGGMAQRYVMDVRDRDAWIAGLDAFTVASGGRLDVLFNNAGIATSGPLAQARFADIDRTVAINFVGVLNGARIGHAYLAKTPGSCLLNTASASAIYGSSGLATYSATKFAVRGLTEALDGEWHAEGIKVRAIVPSFIETPLLDGVAGGTNRSIREAVVGAGLELTSADTVAEAAWTAAHGKAVHIYVGKTAHRLAFAARWMPGSLRKRMKRGLGSEG